MENDRDRIFDEFTVTATIVSPSNIGLIQKAMDEAYELNMINDIFKDPYASRSSTYIDGKLTHRVSNLLKLDFIQKLSTNEKLIVQKAFEDNDVDDWTPKYSARLFHGIDDDWVPNEQSQIAYDAMIANGAQDLQLVDCVTAGNIPTNHAKFFIPYLRINSSCCMQMIYR